MPSRVINLIVVHCSATANGVSLATDERTSAQAIDTWHGAPVRDATGRIVRQHMFHRSQEWRARWQPHLRHIGYHAVIDVDGKREWGRHVDEQGAGVRGHNRNSLHVCMLGTDAFTRPAWAGLRDTVNFWLDLYRNARVCGHRDLSPDADKDGEVEPHEWLKICPGFDATSWWLLKNMEPMEGHIL